MTDPSNQVNEYEDESESESQSPSPSVSGDDTEPPNTQVIAEKKERETQHRRMNEYEDNSSESESESADESLPSIPVEAKGNDTAKVDDSRPRINEYEDSSGDDEESEESEDHPLALMRRDLLVAGDRHRERNQQIQEEKQSLRHYHLYLQLHPFNPWDKRAREESDPRTYPIANKEGGIGTRQNPVFPIVMRDGLRPPRRGRGRSRGRGRGRDRRDFDRGGRDFRGRGRHDRGRGRGYRGRGRNRYERS